jgi:hypothetical protein
MRQMIAQAQHQTRTIAQTANDKNSFGKMSRNLDISSLIVAPNVAGRSQRDTVKRLTIPDLSPPSLTKLSAPLYTLEPREKKAAKPGSAAIRSSRALNNLLGGPTRRTGEQIPTTFKLSFDSKRKTEVPTLRLDRPLGDVSTVRSTDFTRTFDFRLPSNSPS